MLYDVLHRSEGRVEEQAMAKLSSPDHDGPDYHPIRQSGRHVHERRRSEDLQKVSHALQV